MMYPPLPPGVAESVAERVAAQIAAAGRRREGLARFYADKRERRDHGLARRHARKLRHLAERCDGAGPVRWRLVFREIDGRPRVALVRVRPHRSAAATAERTAR